MLTVLGLLIHFGPVVLGVAGWVLRALWLGARTLPTVIHFVSADVEWLFDLAGSAWKSVNGKDLAKVASVACTVGYGVFSFAQACASDVAGILGAVAGLCSAGTTFAHRFYSESDAPK